MWIHVRFALIIVDVLVFCCWIQLVVILIGTISIAKPDAIGIERVVGQLPPDESGVMYRGRAAVKLVENAQLTPWTEYTECPYEDLREPGRVHLDPLGYLQICQGINIGNLFERPLVEICAEFQKPGD